MDVQCSYFGNNYRVRALIDPCFDESFISSNIQKLLKLSASPLSAEVTASFTMHDITFFLDINYLALVVSQVTGETPTYCFDLPMQLSDLIYADPNFNKISKVEDLAAKCIQKF